MSKLISVIIPSYNYGRFIAEAIESVLAQTLLPDEIIVVDDGSTDDTEEILKRFGDKITYIKQENAGVCAARNRGVTASSGEYIAFMDADDIWHPTKLEKQMAKFAEDPDIGLVHCGMREFESNTGEILGTHIEGGDADVAFALLLWEGKVIIGPGGTIILKREAFDSVGGFDADMKVGEDWDFCYRIARKYKVGFVPEVLVDYRSHSEAAHRNIYEMERGMGRFYEKAFETDNSDVLDLKRRAYGNYHKILAGSYFQAGQYGGFVRNAFKSVVKDPRNLGYFLKFPLRKMGIR